MRLLVGLRNLRQFLTGSAAPGAAPALKFNVTTNSQYTSIIAL